MVEELDVLTPHPDRVRPDPPRSRRKVRTGGVAETADPVHVRVSGVASDLALEHLEDVGADDFMPVALVPGHLGFRGIEGQGDIVVVEYADQGTSPRPVA
jgi:hypothetical protein